MPQTLLWLSIALREQVCLLVLIFQGDPPSPSTYAPASIWVTQSPPFPTGTPQSDQEGLIDAYVEWPCCLVRKTVLGVRYNFSACVSLGPSLNLGLPHLRVVEALSKVQEHPENLSVSYKHKALLHQAKSEGRLGRKEP